MPSLKTLDPRNDGVGPVLAWVGKQAGLRVGQDLGFGERRRVAMDGDRRRGPRRFGTLTAVGGGGVSVARFCGLQTQAWCFPANREYSRVMSLAETVAIAPDN